MPDSPCRFPLRAPATLLIVFAVIASLLSLTLQTAQAEVRPGAPAPVDPSQLSELPENMWGVSGYDSNAMTNFDVPVWDFAEIGERIYVAGAFTHVQQNGNSTPFSQPYVAAFDLATGAWIPEFAPQVNGPVFALEVSPRGKLLIGGQFTAVEGAANTAGLASLDPITGARDNYFQASVERPWSSDNAVVRSLEVIDNDLYVGGNFSHVRGNSDTQRVRVYKLTRINAKWGTPDNTWRPAIAGGAVWGFGIDTSRNRIHVGGISLSSVNGQPADRLATIDLTTAQLVGGQAPVSWTHSSAKDIWDVEYAGGKVWTAGTEHVLNILDGDDRSLVGWHTTGHKSDGYNWSGWFTGGDFQVVEQVGDWVFAGCHCTYEYRDHNGFAGYAWYDGVAAQRKPIRLVGALDANTGVAADWSPDLAGSEDGVWAVHGDSLGCLWLGGQFDIAGLEAGATYWVGNMGRFCPPGALDNAGPDTTAPSVPGNTQATANGANVTFTWNAATDDREVVGYAVYRNGAYLTWLDAPATSWNDNNLAPGNYGYQVRSYDAAGNRSSKSTWVSTNVLSNDTTAPSLPANVTGTANGSTVALSWNASIDPSGINGYNVYRDNTWVGWVSAPAATFTDTGVSNGAHTYQVRAYDLAGNRSTKTAAITVQVGAVDTDAPTLPANLAATVNGSTVDLVWTASTDNVAMDGYAIYRNGAYAGWATGTTFADPGVPAGTHLYEVRAYDAAGNRSDKSVAATATV